MLLTVLLIGGSVLGASTIAGYLMLLRINAATDIKNSAKAIFAADAGLDYELYRQFISATATAPVFINSAELFKTSTSGPPFTITSVGRAFNTYRALELKPQ